MVGCASHVCACVHVCVEGHGRACVPLLSPGRLHFPLHAIGHLETRSSTATHPQTRVRVGRPVFLAHRGPVVSGWAFRSLEPSVSGASLRGQGRPGARGGAPRREL